MASAAKTQEEKLAKMSNTLEQLEKSPLIAQETDDSEGEEEVEEDLFEAFLNDDKNGYVNNNFKVKQAQKKMQFLENIYENNKGMVNHNGFLSTNDMGWGFYPESKVIGAKKVLESVKESVEYGYELSLKSMARFKKENDEKASKLISRIEALTRSSEPSVRSILAKMSLVVSKNKYNYRVHDEVIKMVEKLKELE